MSQPDEYLIWLVEDNPADAAITRTAIESVDISTKIEYFQSGKACLESLKDGNSEPDFLFVDLNMPEMGGIELVREVRKHSLSPLPIYIFSASKYMTSSEEVMQAGANGFLEKPLDFYESVSLFEKIILTD